MKLIRAVLHGVCVIMLAVTGMLVFSDMDDSVPSVVYASGQRDDQQILSSRKGDTGVSGILGCVKSLQTYYRESQVLQVSAPGEKVLVGARGVNRSVSDALALKQGAAVASRVGQKAQEAVAENQLSYEDYYTLLQIVEAEATGGDIYSKMLIANVVLNRVKDSHFPDTITEVVWERSDDGSAQFSPTEDGRISTVTITQDTIEAVKRALEGEDNSQGALFFVARDSADAANVYWFDSSLKVLFAYGGHDFFTFQDDA